MSKSLRDPARLGGALRVWLYLFLLATLAYGASAAYGAYLLETVDPATPTSLSHTLPELERADTIRELTGLLAAVLTIVCYFLSAKRLFRVSQNAGSFAARDEVSPTWTIGWFLVPFANLFMPFRRVRKIWQISESCGRSWRDVPVPALLRWWWTFWLATALLDNLSFLRRQLRGETAGDYGATLWIDLISALLTIPLVPLWAAVVRGISSRQQVALAARLAETPDELQVDAGPV